MIKIQKYRIMSVKKYGFYFEFKSLLILIGTLRIYIDFKYKGIRTYVKQTNIKK